MKKQLLTIAMIFMLGYFSIAQQRVTIAGWTFPTGTSADANPDLSNAGNQSMELITVGGTSSIDFSKLGLTTSSAQVSGLDGGVNLKAFQVELSSTGSDSVWMSSIMQSGGNKPGPRDLKIRYRLGVNGIWADVPGGAFLTANNWTTSAVSDLLLPMECGDQPSLFIQWIMTSDTANNGTLVAPDGVLKMDNIYFTVPATTGISGVHQKGNLMLFPVPATEHLNIESGETILDVAILNILGGTVHFETVQRESLRMDVSSYPEGVYFVKVRTTAGTTCRKVYFL